MLRYSLAALLLFCGRAFAEENFPPPEFTIPYRYPEILLPSTRGELWAWLDTGVLALCLLVGAWLAYRVRSRRWLSLLVFFVVLYFGFFRRGCVCSVGALQNVSLALGNGSYAIPVTVAIFFALPILVALFAGRLFCSSACPLGALQELVLIRPVRIPAGLDSALRLIPAIFLGFSVLYAWTGTRFLICETDPFILFFRLSGSEIMLLVGLAVVLLSTVIGRVYCRYLCPYGLILGWASVFAKWRVRITPTECINCHLCADACPYGAIIPPTPVGLAIPRSQGRRELVTLLCLLPVVAILAGGLMSYAAPLLARVHPKVALAERVWAEEQDTVKGQTLASEAFKMQGQASPELYAEALAVHRKFYYGAWVLGLWLGGLFIVRLIALSVRRRRTEYIAEPSACVACARCYVHCPVHLAGGDASAVVLPEEKQ